MDTRAERADFGAVDEYLLVVAMDGLKLVELSLMPVLVEVRTTSAPS